uniref:Uncharacterized protein n=1 Tax=Mastacembelus armatus TaxID=205130 RepID=A0A7N8XCW6_9TELE
MGMVTASGKENFITHTSFCSFPTLSKWFSCLYLHKQNIVIELKTLSRPLSSHRKSKCVKSNLPFLNQVFEISLFDRANMKSAKSNEVLKLLTNTNFNVRVSQ